MTDPKRRRLGPYAKLSATYYRDDAIRAAGEAAEVLFARSLAFCAEHPADGFISDLQLDLIAIGLKNVQGRVDALVREDVWRKVDGGHIVRQWLKWNRSAEEAGMVRKTDRERKARLRAVSDESPAGTGTDS